MSKSRLPNAESAAPQKTLFVAYVAVVVATAAVVLAEAAVVVTATAAATVVVVAVQTDFQDVGAVVEVFVVASSAGELAALKVPLLVVVTAVAAGLEKQWQSFQFLPPLRKFRMSETVARTQLRGSPWLALV